MTAQNVMSVPTGQINAPGDDDKSTGDGQHTIDRCGLQDAHMLSVCMKLGDAMLKESINPNTRQKRWQFASLMGLMLFFSMASPSFMQNRQHGGILQSKRSMVCWPSLYFCHHHRGLLIFVGTLMTFCAVHGGRVFDLLGLPFYAALRQPFSLARFRVCLGRVDCQAKIPPFSPRWA